MRRKKYGEGDFIEIPLGDGKYAYGQLIFHGGLRIFDFYTDHQQKCNKTKK